MKKTVSFLLCLLLLFLLTPVANAAEWNSDLCPDLSEYIKDKDRRTFVQQTVGYQLRHDPAVRETLENGYCAVFFFEGCSDNMTHPEYKNLDYYRVSAACLVIQLDDKGVPQVTYYNGACSTLPDRPTDYGPRKEEVPADVGPATICDGTYQVYSIRHRDMYEALHVRTAEENDTVPAIYMTPHGYTKVQATQINIHTRTNNHVLKYDMWSEGCVLVGGGEPQDFEDFMASTYYGVHDYFVLGVRVGTVSINRQYLKEDLYQLYGDEDAVDFLLSGSRPYLPRKYLEFCGAAQETGLEDTLWAVRDTQVMSLPCGNATDARSIPLGTIPADGELMAQESIVNTRGARWYVTDYQGQKGYVYSGDFTEPTKLERFWRNIFG